MNTARSFYKLVFMLMLLLIVGVPTLAQEQDTEGDQPEQVTIPGTIQSVLGCDGDWAPDCDATALTYDVADTLWRGTFEIPAGDYEYKVAINDSWDENYGAGAQQDGPNVTLSLEEAQSVTFLYDHDTHWFADNVNHVIANVAGSFQSELGCPAELGADGDWAPDCLRTWLQDLDGDGVYTYVAESIPAGDYEAKVAINESWDENYGADGEPDGANIPFTVEEDNAPVAFLFNAETNAISINTDGSIDPGALAGNGEEAGGTPIDVPARPLEVEQPEQVVIPGTLQSAVGCDGDWQPDCEATALSFLPEQDVWQGTFELPAGDYEYKVAINGSWEENYGGAADPGGPNVQLSLEEAQTITFTYDHFTNWVADSVDDPLVTAPGSFQSELGCPTSMGAEGDWAPGCLRSWLQDPNGDGIFTFATEAIPAGDYEVKVAVGGTWDENYGAGGEADGANITFSVPEGGTKVTFAYNSSDNRVSIGVGEPAVVGRVSQVDLDTESAYWVTEDTIAWELVTDASLSYRLHYAADAGLEAADGAITGGESLALSINADGLPAAVLEKFPHLEGQGALQIDEADLSQVPSILRGQVVVAAYDGESLIGATGLQIPGVLDDLYTYDGALGATFNDGVPSVRLWAPTAQNVRFHLFEDANPDTESTVYDMTRDNATGVWQVDGESDWTDQYYLFEVQVYAPTVGRVVTNMVTDPYSYSLSMNSERSQLIDLHNDPSLMPEGWESLEKPTLPAPEDIAIYEMHMRDFSVHDPAVPDDLQGKFPAFTVTDSNGMNHLRQLAESGLTHIHMLPSFDIATINENPDERVEPDPERLASFPPDSPRQAEIINEIRDQDAFNWGYDPLHYTVPEGSYATEPTGAQRVLEFRQMVQALNENGLRLVMDVVYNHTNAAGQSDNSVLDRIVPGYYHRLDTNGNVTTSTCCQNTATEHNMMRKLMVDSVRTWVEAYKVDGFRFDLMGHHMVDDMLEVRETLDALTMEADGVDGKAIYVYGEGWNFGEVADGARGFNATQLNMAGTGIGVFNDRLRDAARGGSPFSGQQEQGFINGLFTDPNEVTPGTPEEQRERVLLFADQIRVGLAGNLADYSFVNREGETVTGADVDYNGSPAGYTADPQENIVYVAAHDNETLWDAIQYKAPADADIDTRVRMNNMGVSLVALTQGVPFFHAGDDLLRSKSLDRDSYNSGDWFNKLDFTYEDNNWGVGLPPSSEENWDIIGPLLVDEDLYVESDDIQNAATHLREMLRVRNSSPLFRLQTAEDVQARVRFHNTGADQLPGLIVMSISDQVDDMESIDPERAMVVAVFNARDEAVTFDADAFAGMDFALHPVLADSADPLVQESAFTADGFNIPARTTAVFIAGE